jgi:hypothetical protein
MRLEKFDNFTSKIQENEYSYYGGNTSFSRWLRRIDDKLDSEYRSLKGDDKPSNDLGARTLKMASAGIPLFSRLITSGGAAIADFFFKGKDRSRYSRMSKQELRKHKKDVLEDWEEETIKNKKVTEKDAEEFYKSGVLKGKKYFGEKYDPRTPEGDDQKEYTEYFTSAMKKYYQSLK